MKKFYFLSAFLLTTLITFGQSIDNVSISDVSCNGGSDGAIDITISGFTIPITYAWTGPSSFTASIEDISDLIPGNYNITVTGSNGTDSELNITVGEPSDITFTATANDPQCFGELGTVTLASSGGTGTLTYSGDLTTN
ncbi:SprB repeat-containing protein, partial [Hyunsoonleella aestuarii]